MNLLAPLQTYPRATEVFWIVRCYADDGVHQTACCSREQIISDLKSGIYSNPLQVLECELDGWCTDASADLAQDILDSLQGEAPNKAIEDFLERELGVANVRRVA